MRVLLMLIVGLPAVFSASAPRTARDEGDVVAFAAKLALAAAGLKNDSRYEYVELDDLLIDPQARQNRRVAVIGIIRSSGAARWVLGAGRKASAHVLVRLAKGAVDAGMPEALSRGAHVVIVRGTLRPRAKAALGFDDARDRFPFQIYGRHIEILGPLPEPVLRIHKGRPMVRAYDPEAAAGRRWVDCGKDGNWNVSGLKKDPGHDFIGIAILTGRPKFYMSRPIATAGMVLAPVMTKGRRQFILSPDDSAAGQGRIRGDQLLVKMPQVSREQAKELLMMGSLPHALMVKGKLLRASAEDRTGFYLQGASYHVLCRGGELR